MPWQVRWQRCTVYYCCVGGYSSSLEKKRDHFGKKRALVMHVCLSWFFCFVLLMVSFVRVRADELVYYTAVDTIRAVSGKEGGVSFSQGRGDG